MLRGNYAAKIDDKGRLKIPNAFRALIEKTHGSELFVTSLTGESVRVYPMPVWLALEERLARWFGDPRLGTQLPYGSMLVATIVVAWFVTHPIEKS